MQLGKAYLRAVTRAQISSLFRIKKEVIKRTQPTERLASHQDPLARRSQTHQTHQTHRQIQMRDRSDTSR